MKLFKKTLRKIVVIVLITVFVFTFTASATATTQADLLSLIQSLSTQYTGPNAQNALAQAYVWLRQNTIDDAQAAYIAGHIQAALSLAGDATAFLELSASQVQQILYHANAAAEALNLTLATDLAGGTFTFRDASGNVAVTATATTGPSGTSAGIIQQTGIDHSVVIIITLAVASLFGVAAITSVSVRKKKQSISIEASDHTYS